jgi:adenylate cyclase
MLNIRVKNARQRQQIEHAAGPIRFGRGQQREANYFQVEDQYVSRDHLLLEELPGGHLYVENLSHKNPIAIADGPSIPVGASQHLNLPVRLTIGNTLVEIDPGSSETPEDVALQTLTQTLPPADWRPVPRLLRELGEAPTPGQFARWLETVIALQRTAVGSPEIYAQAAHALVELVGLDLGMVLIRRGESWETVAVYTANPTGSRHFSHSLLDRVVAERQTFYQSLEGASLAALSLRNIEAVVASPILGVHEEVVGVLYGSRDVRSTAYGGHIRPLDAQVVQLLAAAVGANLARAQATRTRVQFEQFFSPELVRQLEEDPNLLEGKNQEVTILCSDLRGFSRLSERLGAENTCRLVRDLMERLSDRIVDQGGVIVDYAGDGILAMWNAPVHQEDHAPRACRAALAMLEELPGLNERWRAMVGGPLSLGIALNTGPAQVGNTGSSRKFKYGPHGHTVNLASRVQTTTKSLRLPLLVTGPTRDRLSATFATRRLGQIRLAGLADAVTLFELHGESASPEWLMRRDAYEHALQLYETRQWSKACQALIPLLDLSEGSSLSDAPTLKLMRRATECLEAPPETFDPVIDWDGANPA